MSDARRARGAAGRRRALAALALASVGVAAAPAAVARSRAEPRATQGQAPPATLLYQNFPNPFPGTGTAAANAVRAAGAPATCIWFDLARASPVRLELFTLRGDRVRVLVPSPALSGVLPPDRYGRAGGSDAGCDPRLTWDGAAEDGRLVPPGVYLLRLQADGSSQLRKVLFRGR